MKQLPILLSFFLASVLSHGQTLKPLSEYPSTLDKFPEVRPCVSNAFNLFQLPLRADELFRAGYFHPNDPFAYSISSERVDVMAFIKDNFIQHASDKVAAKEMWARGRLPNPDRPARMDHATMEARARAYAARLGVNLTADHKYWEGPRMVRENYKPKEQVWAFLWHRYYGGVPVWNDYIILTLDDPTGKLLFFSNMARPYRYEQELKSVIPMAEARAKAIKYYVARHPGSDYEDPKKAKMGTYEKTMHFYYVQEELRPEKLKLLKNPKDDQRLRLCHGIYVSCWFKGEEDKPMRVLDLVMVDAVTGEEVVRNAID
jgi:hypothetical protein